MFFWLLEAAPHSLARGPFLPAMASRLLCLSCLSLSLIRTPVITPDPAASLPHLKTLHHTCKAPLSCNIVIGSVGHGRDISGGRYPATMAGLLSVQVLELSLSGACSGTSPRGRKELAGLFPPWDPSLRTWVTHGKASPKSLQLGWETFKWGPNPNSRIKEEQNISASVSPLLPPCK